MIEARVLSLESNDHADWTDFEQYESADAYDDYGWFHVTIGASDMDGGNDFQVCVATPRACGRVRSAGAVPGILVERFDAETVQQAIGDRVSSISAHTWDQIVNELRTFMIWEYEGMAGS
ncbi:MAG TPA: Imm8 family immunity protein [Thermoguttaceae bacterium]|nr:Imm8 family immunity protein [Thermoguttaceae bacterium]